MQQFIRILLSLFFGFMVSLTHASEEQGLLWLKQAVTAPNTVSGANQSVASLFQAQTETAYSLALLDQLPSDLNALKDDDQSTEALSRTLLIAQKANADTTSLQQQLFARQNADGGFGHLNGWQSNPLDSAWVLLSLHSGSQQSNVDLLKAYLYKKILSDGSIVGLSHQANLESASLMLLAFNMLGSTPDLQLYNAQQKIANWLIRQQSITGEWDQDLYLSAFALGSLSAVSADTNIKQLTNGYLLEKQAVDGSWDQDPFLTAVILRALSQAKVDVLATNTLIGKVLSADNNYPIVGVQVSLNNINVLTDGDGQFALSGLTAGQQNVQLALTGYQTSLLPTNIPQRGKVDVGTVILKPIANTSVLMGKVIDALTQQPIANATISVGTVVTHSDAAGNYQVANLPVGLQSIIVTATGYVSMTTNTTLANGTLLFKPVLYAEGSQVGSGPAQVIGNVASLGGQALAGVQIKVDQQLITTTNSLGDFSLNVAEGSHRIEFQLAGYTIPSQQMVLNKGDRVTLGTVVMTAVVTSTTVEGIVRDSTTHAPIVGATVEVIGVKSVITDSLGHYVIDGIVDASFGFKVNALGYNSQNLQLQQSQPTVVYRDIDLDTQNSTNVLLSAISSNQQVLSLDTPVEFSMQYQNNSTDTINLVPTLQILDSNNKVVSTAIAYAKSTDTIPLGSFGLVAGASQAVVFKWNSGQFSPDHYSLIARASLADTINGSNAMGTVIAQRPSAIEVVAAEKTIGFIKATPSVQRANDLQPISMSAVFQNKGNITSNAQTLTVQVVDQNSVVVFTTAKSLPQLDVQQIAKLDFGTWNGNTKGHYTLNIIDSHNNKVSDSTTVYIGDATTGVFTVNKTTVPTGTQTVRGQIALQGISNLNATVNDDDMVGLIKAALAKSVPYNDNESSAWVSRNGCAGCHIASQAIVGGELTNKFVPRNAAARELLLNSIKQDKHTDGSFYNTAPTPITQTALDLWAMSSWEKSKDVIGDEILASDFLMKNQQSNGGWVGDRQDAWWQDNYTINALIPYSLNRLHGQMSLDKTINLQSYTERAWGNNLSTNPNVNMTTDENGDIYISLYKAGTDHIIVRMNLDGTYQTIYTSIGVGHSAAYIKIKQGLLYIGVYGVIKVINIASGATLQTYTSPTSLKFFQFDIDDNGNIYTLSSYGQLGGDVYLLKNGTISSLYTNTGRVFFSSIVRLVDGRLFLGSFFDGKIFQLQPDKTLSYILKAPFMDGVYRNMSQTDGVYFNMSKANDESIVLSTGGLLSFDSKFTHPLANVRTESVITLKDGSILARLPNRQSYSYITFSGSDNTNRVAALANSLDKSWSYWQQHIPSSTDSNKLHAAFALMALSNIAESFERNHQLDKLQQVQALYPNLVNMLYAKQNSDGGWSQYDGGLSDPLITAIIGYSIMGVNKHQLDAGLRKAVNYELTHQGVDGSWNTKLFTTRVSATTWVSIFLPIALDRLISLNANVYLTTSSQEHLANPNISPKNKVTNNDGSVQYHWDFSDSYTDQDLTFDLTLDNLRTNEERPVATEGHIVFDNRIDQGQITANLDIPKVTATTGLALTTVTDQPSYGANSLVGISNTIANMGVNIQQGRVHLAVYSSDGTVVTDLGDVSFSSLTPTNQQTLQTTWSTGLFKPDTYKVDAELYDANNTLVVKGHSSFAIAASSPSGNLLGSFLSIDKNSYTPQDMVQIQARINNLAINTSVKNVLANTRVIDPDGQIVFTHQESVTDLAANTMKSFNLSLPVANAKAGLYTVELTGVDSSGVTQVTSTANYQIESTATSGVGLNGSLQLSAPSLIGKNLVRGDVLTIAAVITNKGNAGVSSAPMNTLIIDTATGNVIAQWQDLMSLEKGQQVTLSHVWPSQGAYYSNIAVVVQNGLSSQNTLTQQVLHLSNPIITTTISSDKTSYDINDSVTITNHFVNQSAVNVSGVTVVTTITSPIGQVVKTDTSTASINAQGQLDQAMTYALSRAAAGQWTVNTVVQDAQGVELNRQQSNFTVLSSAVTGTGISGTAQAPSSVVKGQAVTLSWTVKNEGNVDLTAVPVRVLLVDAQQVVVATLTDTVSAVAINATAQGQSTWTANVAYGSVVTATEQIQVNGVWKSLASATITVTKPEITTTISSDKTSYDLNDPVTITNHFVNQSAVNVSGVTVVTTITSPTGQVVKTDTATVAINAQGQLDKTVAYALSRAAVGQWVVTTVVQDAQGVELNRQQSNFTVLSSAVTGTGISGTVQAPTSVVKGQAVTLSWTVKNEGNVDLTAVPVRVQLVDAQQAVIATLTDTVSAVAINATTQGQSTWTANVAYGSVVTATEQIQVNGVWKSLASTTITVMKPAITTTISSDKTSYDINDPVTITNHFVNQSAVNVSGVTVVTTITSPTGQVVKTDTATVAINAQGQLDKTVAYALSRATAGQWTVNTVVQDAQGVELNRQQSNFTVLSSAVTGTGISATLVATPVEVKVGDSVALALSVKNLGNADLTNQAITLTIVRNQEATPAQVLTTTISTLAQNGTIDKALSWIVAGKAGDTFTVTASTVFNGKTKVLASSAFIAKASAVVAVEMKQEIATQSRVLVYYNCGHDWYKDMKGWSFGDDHYACFSSRAATLKGYLDSLAINYTVVTKDSDFIKAFRSGRYNSTWLLGAIEKLPKDFNEELHEAINRGDALLLDGGVETWYNHDIYDIAGVQYRGRLNFSNSQLTPTLPVFTNTTAIGKPHSAGWPLYLKTTTGTVTATYGATQCQSVQKDWDHEKEHDEDREFYGRHDSTYPAIVSNVYGKGKAMSMAFDLIGSLEQPKEKASWLALLQQSLTWSVPVVTTRTNYVAHEFITLRSTLTNASTTAQSTKLQVKLPVGAVWMGAGTVAADRSITQTITVPAKATQQVWLPLLLPTLAGTHTATLSLLTTDGVLIGSAQEQRFTVQSAEQRLAQVRIAFEQLNLNKADDKHRDDAVKDLASAQNLWSRGRYDDALHELGEAAEEVRDIAGRNVSVERLALDELMKAISIQWFDTQR